MIEIGSFGLGAKYDYTFWMHFLWGFLFVFSYLILDNVIMFMKGQEKPQVSMMAFSRVMIYVNESALIMAFWMSIVFITCWEVQDGRNYFLMSSVKFFDVLDWISWIAGSVLAYFTIRKIERNF